MIYVKNLKITDLNDYNIIRNRFVEKKNTPNETEKHMNNFINEINIIRYGIYLYDSNIMIGFCSIGNINFIEKYCSIHIAILEKYQNKGYGKKTLNILHNIICNVYNLQFIYLICNKDNEIALKLYNSLGYTIVNHNPTENKNNHFNMIHQESILFLNKEMIPKYNVVFPDIYFSYQYGGACEFSDNAEWECCLYKDLIYVYLKKKLEYKGVIYYELITPYGYSGYYYKNKETYKDFIKLFRIEAKKKKYISEILRQNPYLNITITDYEILKQKKIYTTEIANYEDYFLNILNSKTRNILRKAYKSDFEYRIEECNDDNMSLFIEMYTNTMNKVTSTSYYYFNKGYFKEISKICKIIIITKKNKIIGQSLVIFYNNFIHYHLSCSDYSSNLITNFLLDIIIKEYGLDKKVVLGGGLFDNDSLCKFKKKISTNSYDYTIYTNILNDEVYNKLNFTPLNI